ncbi:hypothetical protein [Vreelandella arcis]|uniref:Uncharacterized protein n=1 Tax=Vreelandella arcis TaxID=416873 RepID=A0A1H0JD56_9GAMM|nr:hypothetical protein [Halomonas arcis]SDO41735.1 hypothetical protein SAMN04487951_12611 [Halomonas arcis]
MTTGPSNKPLSEQLAERREKQLAELDELTQRLLSEHESGLRRLLSDAQSTTASAIHRQNEHLSTTLNETEQRQRQQIESIEQRLSAAADQAERLNKTGGMRSWTRPVAITVAVMLAVGGVTAGGLAVADRVIDSRLARLSALNTEIERAESQPRLPEGVEIRTIEGESYLVGVDPKKALTGTINDGQTPVIGLTRGEED